ncbi:MAG: hypothetical protein QOJ19_4766, partial [Acidimicrobiia bacterium]|nr:hypothetical protein [Acidimicrobiia bacterium]
MSPPPDLGTLRGRMAEATDGAVAAHARLAAARSAIERIRQTGLGDLAQAEADLQAASGASQASAVAVEGVRSDLRDALITHVGTVTTAAPVAPAEVPVALLPVGIETRFQGDTLLIRVIPDEFHVEDHEPELTDGEVDVGRTFWVQVWRGGTEEPAATEAEQLAWTRLVAAVGSSRRAAWVADRTAPNPQGRPAAAVPDDQPLADPALPDSPFPGPAFPDPPRRAAAWSRAAMARTLPDQFVAIAYRRQGSGGQTTWNEIGRATGGPVDDAVQLGFDPAAPPPAVTDDGPALPDGMRWMVDVAAAERVGLLLRLTLPPGTTTVDRLVVLGVLGSLDPEASADRLADLLVGHHHTRGLEMLPIGAPTNNTAAERSAHRSTDDPVGSFTVERRTPRPPAGSDGGLLARALGLPVDTLRGVARSNDTEQAAAGEMNALIWPAAFGYWLESLVQPGPGDAIIADLRRHAVQMVRGRGPLPPLRVGRQPYGVLPVTSLQRWQPSHEPAGLVQAVGFLRSALPWWL